MNAKLLIVAVVLAAFAAISVDAQGNYTLAIRLLRAGKTRHLPYGRLSFSVTQDNGRKSKVGESRRDQLFLPLIPRIYRVDLPVNLTVIKSLGVTFNSADKNNTDPRVRIPRIGVRRPWHRWHLFVRRCNETVISPGVETQYWQVRRRRAVTCLEAPEETSGGIESTYEGMEGEELLEGAEGAWEDEFVEMESGVDDLYAGAGTADDFSD